MLKRVKRIQGGLIHMDYISKSRFKYTPQQLFLCIWPQKPAQPRATFNIAKKKQTHILDVPWLAVPESLKYQLLLHSIQKKFFERQEKFYLRIEKKSEVLDAEGFFTAIMSKGHNIEISTDKAQEPDVIFEVNFHNRNKKFQKILAQLGEAIKENKSISLLDFIHNAFFKKVETHNTYGFAIYIQVKAFIDKIELKKAFMRKCIDLNEIVNCL